MRILFKASVLLAILTVVAGEGRSQETTDKEKVTVDRELLERLEERIGELESEVERLKGAGRDEPSADLERRIDRVLEEDLGEEDLFIPRRAVLAAEAGETDYFSDVYTKPFLYQDSSISIGGYLDLEYQDAEDDDRTFDPHRFVPFIYADVTERVKVAAEIEIEHGEELSAEFAFMDYEIIDELNLRAGIILSPLGKFNLVHDSPIQDLTTRPLVTRTVVPAVSREAGLGFFGSFVPRDEESEWQVGYELYFSTGFKGLERDGTNVITQSAGLRDARAKTSNGGSGSFRDNNNNIATMGRVSVSPHAGLEAGLSMHTGSYDERGDNGLTLVDVDLTVAGSGLTRYVASDGFLAEHVLAPTEFLFEYANANISRDAFARASGVIGDMDGFYSQINYHVYPAFLKRLAEQGFVGDGAHFTAVARYGETDLDGAERARTTLGFNFRPNASRTVVKLEYQWNRESGDLSEIDNDAFWLSLATYF